MSDKKIFSVDIDDGELKKFAETFAQFQAETKKIPGAWAEAATWAKQSASDFEKMNADALKAQRATKEKATDKAVQQIDRAGFAWVALTRGSKLFVSHIGNATQSLLRWTGLTAAFGAILGAGGLFGISRMASVVSQGRGNAMGLGVTYGEQASFGTNFGRLGNADALLGGFSRALHDSNSRGALYSILGPNAAHRLSGKDASSAFAEALPDIQRLLKRSPEGTLQQTVESYRLNELGFDVNSAQALRNMSPEETKEMLAAHEDTAKRLGLSEKDQLSYRNFMDQMDRAEMQIGTHFARGLSRLAPGVSKFSEVFRDVIENLLTKGGPVENWLKKVNKYLVAFGQDLKSGEVDKWAKELSGALTSISNLLGNAQSDPTTGLFGQAPRSPGQAKANAIINGVGRAVRGIIVDTFESSDSHKAHANPGHALVGRSGFRREGRDRGDRETADALATLPGADERSVAAELQRLRPTLGSSECVALAKAAVGSRAGVSEWRRGDNVTSAPLAAGTPIATFMDRRGRPSDRYDGGQGVGARGNNTTHAAVFLGYAPDGIRVAEQYAGSGGMHVHTYKYDDPRGGEKDARNYFSINDPTGNPLGPRNPMRNPKFQGGGAREVEVDNSDNASVINTKIDRRGAFSLHGWVPQ